MIDPNVVNACKQVDIVALIGRTLKLRRRGAEFVALCPFHDENTPSFAVIPRKNAFYCHGCRVGGSTIDWLMRSERMTFREAVDMLASGENLEVREVASRAAPTEPSQTSLRGRRAKGPVLRLDPAVWQAWRDRPTGAVEAFAEARRLPAELLRDLGMVDCGEGRVAFVYVDPERGTPCSAKVRAVAAKNFFVVPRAGEDDDPNARALLPLYLAHDLAPFMGQFLQIVTITEGEVDALTLRAMGLRNVVSLPQGVGSAKYTDLTPIAPFNAWILSTDADAEGDAAAVTLRERARAVGADTVRVRWTRMTQDGEVVVAKDANDFLKGGATPEDFHRCVTQALTERFRFCPEFLEVR